MLQIQKLTITMRKDLRVLLRDFTFALHPGDKCALIGEEGNGKSTLLKWIYDGALVEDYAECTGTLQKSGLILGYLAQEMTEAEKEKTVYDFCCDAPAFAESTPGELAAVAGELKLPVELFYTDRLMRTLSGGEKVKLRMAVILLQRPDVLLLDEPSNDIDIETLEWMERFIRESETPVLFISHDETLLENTANAVIHMEQLRRKTLPRYTVARMGYRAYVENRLHKFAHQEQVARKEREEQKKQQERYRRLYEHVDHDLNAVSRQEPGKGRLLKKKMKAVKSMEKRFDREAADMTEIPDTEESILAQFDERIAMPAGKTVLDYTLPLLAVDGRTLARDISLTVRGPAHVCIIGRNGAGKTTLLKKIADELLPRTDIKAAYMPQDYAEHIDERLTPVDFLARSGEKEELTRVKTFLGSMKYTLEEFAHSMAGLSGGQKVKLFFLRMILHGCDVLLLDEPTRNFSPLSNPVIRGILRDFGGAIISVSHDRKYIDEVCPVVFRLAPDGLHPVERDAPQVH